MGRKERKAFERISSPRLCGRQSILARPGPVVGDSGGLSRELPKEDMRVEKQSHRGGRTPNVLALSSGSESKSAAIEISPDMHPGFRGPRGLP